MKRESISLPSHRILRFLLLLKHFINVLGTYKANIYRARSVFYLLMSTYQPTRSSNRGISPVIGVAILVAITIALAALVGFFVITIGENASDNNSPNSSVLVDENPDGVTVKAQGLGSDTEELAVYSGDTELAAMTEPGQRLTVQAPEDTELTVVQVSEDGSEEPVVLQSETVSETTASSISIVEDETSSGIVSSTPTPSPSPAPTPTPSPSPTPSPTPTPAPTPTPLPDGQVAFDDQNGNGMYDSGETTYTKSEVFAFNDKQANLIIPSGSGDLKSSGKIKIQSGSFESAVDLNGRQVKISSDSGDIQVEDVVSRKNNVRIDSAEGIDANESMIKAGKNNVKLIAQEDINVYSSTVKAGKNNVKLDTDGSINAGSSTISSDKNNVSLTAQEGITVDNSTVKAGKNDVKIDSGGFIDASNATIKSKKNNVKLTSEEDVTIEGSTVKAGKNNVRIDSDGSINASDSEIASGKNNVKLMAHDNIDVQSAEITLSKGDATASVSDTSKTIFVEGLIIEDRDNALGYNPDDSSVIDGTPEEGGVEP